MSLRRQGPAAKPGQLDRRVFQPAIRHLGEKVIDQVQPPAALVVEFDDVPGRMAQVCRLEHRVARPPVLDVAPARFQIVGVEVGELLEQSENDHQLADAARVLRDGGVVLAIARVVGIAEVEKRHTVERRLIAEKAAQRVAEPRVGLRQIELRSIQ